MNGHKSDLRKYLNGTSNKTESFTLYEHFKEHSQDTFKFQILQKIDTKGSNRQDIRKWEGILDEREREWMWKLDTIVPKGLNTDDGFHQQTRKSRKTRTIFH